MKNSILKICIITLILNVSLLSFSFSQKIGILPIYTWGSDFVLFVDGDAGEIVNSAVLPEPIGPTMTNLEEDAIYFVSHHYIVRLNTLTGEIEDEYKFMDILVQQPEELSDPNLSIIPMGVTKNGHALIMFNETMREKQIASKRAINNENLDKADEILKEMESIKPISLYLVDINNKSFTKFGDFSNYEQFGYDFKNGNILIWNTSNGRISIVDIASNKTIREETIKLNFNTIPELSGRKLSFSLPTLNLDNVLTVSITAIDTTLYQHESYNVSIDLNISKVIQIEKKLFNPSSDAVAAHTVNCKMPWFYKVDSDIGEVPQTPVQAETPELTGTSKKKVALFNQKMKEWEDEEDRKNNEYSKALKEYNQRIMDPASYTITISHDQEMKEPVLVMNGNGGGTIYNDKYLLSRNTSAISLYSLEDGKILWEVDTDY